MKKMTNKLLFFVIIFFILAGCTTGPYSTKKDNYLTQVQAIHPIVIPSGATAPAQQPYYSVPRRSIKVPNQPPSLVPPTLKK